MALFFFESFWGGAGGAWVVRAPKIRSQKSAFQVDILTG